MLSDLTIGQILAVEYFRERATGPRRISDAKITKIGKRWVYLDNDCRFDPEEGYPYELDGGDWGSPGRVMLSREALDEYIKVEKVWAKVKTYFQRWPTPPTDLTEAELLAIAQRLGVEQLSPNCPHTETDR
jgi:hypothetical protein